MIGFKGSRSHCRVACTHFILASMSSSWRMRKSKSYSTSIMVPYQRHDMFFVFFFVFLFFCFFAWAIITYLPILSMLSYQSYKTFYWSLGCLSPIATPELLFFNDIYRFCYLYEQLGPSATSITQDISSFFSIFWAPTGHLSFVLSHQSADLSSMSQPDQMPPQHLTYIVVEDNTRQGIVV